MRKSPLKNRLLSLVIAFSFLATNLNVPAARGEKGTGRKPLPVPFSTATDLNLPPGFGANVGAPLAGAHGDRAGTSPAPTIEISKIQVPPAIGKIEETYDATSEKLNKSLVVLIRDAHSIPEAQKNIQKIIGHFRRNYGIRLIGAEGAEGELDARIFQSFPDKEKLKQVFAEYMEQGELTGVNAAAVFGDSSVGAPLAGAQRDRAGTSPAPTAYQGLEDWNLYVKSLELYLAAMAQEPELLENLKREESSLKREKEKSYSKELLEIDQALEDFHAGQGDLAALLKKMAAVGAPLAGAQRARAGTSPAPTPGIRSLIEEINNDKGVWGKDELKREQKYSQMSNRFLEEFEAYSRSVKESLFRNEEERRIDRESHQLDLMKKLARLELSREDWGEIKTVDHRLQTTDKNEENQKGLWSVVYGLLSSHFAFYQNTEQRDEVLFGNLIKMSGKENALCVAGGFHTEVLAARLKEKGISYVVVRPAIGRLPETDFYRNQMKGDFSWKNYFEIEGGQINLYKAFVRATRDRLLGVGAPLAGALEGRGQAPPLQLKQWRDQLLRDLASQGRIDKASGYLSLLDETGQKVTAQKRAELKAKWLKNIDHFISKFRGLQSRGKLTEQNILEILKPFSTPSLVAGILGARAEVRADFFVSKAVRSGQSPNEPGTPLGHGGLRSESRNAAEDWIRDLEPLVEILKSPGMSGDEKIKAFEIFNKLSTQAFDFFTSWTIRKRKLDDESAESLASLAEMLFEGSAAAAFETKILVAYPKDVDDKLKRSVQLFNAIRGLLGNRKLILSRLEIVQILQRMGDRLEETIIHLRKMLVRTDALTDRNPGKKKSITETDEEREHRILFLGVAPVIAATAVSLSEAYLDILDLLPKANEKDLAKQALRSGLIEALADMSHSFIASADLFGMIRQVPAVGADAQDKVNRHFKDLEKRLTELPKRRGFLILKKIARNGENTEENRVLEVLDAIESVRGIVLGTQSSMPDDKGAAKWLDNLKARVFDEKNDVDKKISAAKGLRDFLLESASRLLEAQNELTQAPQPDSIRKSVQLAYQLIHTLREIAEAPDREPYFYLSNELFLGAEQALSFTSKILQSPMADQEKKYVISVLSSMAEDMQDFFVDLTDFIERPDEKSDLEYILNSRLMVFLAETIHLFLTALSVDGNQADFKNTPEVYFLSGTAKKAAGVMRYLYDSDLIPDKVRDSFKSRVMPSIQRGLLYQTDKKGARKLAPALEKLQSLSSIQNADPKTDEGIQIQRAREILESITALEKQFPKSEVRKRSDIDYFENKIAGPLNLPPNTRDEIIAIMQGSKKPYSGIATGVLAWLTTISQLPGGLQPREALWAIHELANVPGIHRVLDKINIDSPESVTGFLTEIIFAYQKQKQGYVIHSMATDLIPNIEVDIVMVRPERYTLDFGVLKKEIPREWNSHAKRWIDSWLLALFPGVLRLEKAKTILAESKYFPKRAKILEWMETEINPKILKYRNALAENRNHELLLEDYHTPEELRAIGGFRPPEEFIFLISDSILMKKGGEQGLLKAYRSLPAAGSGGALEVLPVSGFSWPELSKDEGFYKVFFQPKDQKQVIKTLRRLRAEEMAQREQRQVNGLRVRPGKKPSKASVRSFLRDMMGAYIGLENPPETESEIEKLKLENPKAGRAYQNLREIRERLGIPLDARLWLFKLASKMKSKEMPDAGKQAVKNWLETTLLESGDSQNLQSVLDLWEAHFLRSAMMTQEGKTRAELRGGLAGDDRFGEPSAKKYYDQIQEEAEKNAERWEAEAKTLSERLRNNSIDPDEVMEIIYPASGNLDQMLLVGFRKVFPKLKKIHLIDWEYAHESPDKSFKSRVEKEMEKIFGEDPVPEILLYDKDYFSYDTGESAPKIELGKEGRRIWIDKYPDPTAELRTQRSFYKSTLERKYLRPGDLVFTIPTGKPPAYKWENPVLFVVKIPFYDKWNNGVISIVTKEDFEALAGLDRLALSRQQQDYMELWQVLAKEMPEVPMDVPLGEDTVGQFSPTNSYFLWDFVRFIQRAAGNSDFSIYEFGSGFGSTASGMAFAGEKVKVSGIEKNLFLAQLAKMIQEGIGEDSWKNLADAYRKTYQEVKGAKEEPGLEAQLRQALEEKIQTIQQKLKETGAGERVHLSQGDGLSEDFGKYDLVYLNYPSFKEPFASRFKEQFFQKLRELRPGAYVMLFSYPNEKAVGELIDQLSQAGSGFKRTAEDIFSGDHPILVFQKEEPVSPGTGQTVRAEVRIAAKQAAIESLQKAFNELKPGDPARPIPHIQELVNLKYGKFQTTFPVPSGKGIGKQISIGAGTALLNIKLKVKRLGEEEARGYGLAVGKKAVYGLEFLYQSPKGKGKAFLIWDGENYRPAQDLVRENLLKAFQELKPGDPARPIPYIRELVNLKRGTLLGIVPDPFGENISKELYFGAVRNLLAIKLRVKRLGEAEAQGYGIEAGKKAVYALEFLYQSPKGKGKAIVIWDGENYRPVQDLVRQNLLKTFRELKPGDPAQPISHIQELVNLKQRKLFKTFPDPFGSNIGKWFNFGASGNISGIKLKVKRLGEAEARGYGLEAGEKAVYALEFSYKSPQGKGKAIVIWDGESYVTLQGLVRKNLLKSFQELKPGDPARPILHIRKLMYLKYGNLRRIFPDPFGKNIKKTLYIGAVHNLSDIKLRVKRLGEADAREYGIEVGEKGVYELEFLYRSPEGKGKSVMIWDGEDYVTLQEIARKNLLKAFRELKPGDPARPILNIQELVNLKQGKLQEAFPNPSGENIGKNPAIGTGAGLSDIKLEVKRLDERQYRLEFFYRKKGEPEFRKDPAVLIWDGTQYIVQKTNGETLLSPSSAEILQRILLGIGRGDWDGIAEDYTAMLENLGPFWRHWYGISYLLDFIGKKEGVKGIEMLKGPFIYGGTGPMDQTLALVTDIFQEMGIEQLPGRTVTDRSLKMQGAARRREVEKKIPPAERIVSEMQKPGLLSGRYGTGIYPSLDLIGEAERVSAVAELNRVLKTGAYGLLSVDNGYFTPEFLDSLVKAGFELLTPEAVNAELNDDQARRLAERLGKERADEIIRKIKSLRSQFVIIRKVKDVSKADLLAQNPVFSFGEYEKGAERETPGPGIARFVDLRGAGDDLIRLFGGEAKIQAEIARIIRWAQNQNTVEELIKATGKKSDPYQYFKTLRKYIDAHPQEVEKWEEPVRRRLLESVAQLMIYYFTEPENAFYEDEGLEGFQDFKMNPGMNPVTKLVATLQGMRSTPLPVATKPSAQALGQEIKAFAKTLHIPIRSEARKKVDVAFENLANIRLDEIKDGDLLAVVQRKIQDGLGGAPERGSSHNLKDYIGSMKAGEEIIRPDDLPPAIETQFGSIDLSYLNDVKKYEGLDAAAQLARDLNLAHLLGLITISKFNGNISPKRQPLTLLKKKGNNVELITASWADWALLKSRFEQAVLEKRIESYQGNDGQLRFYKEVFGVSARDKHAGILYSVISRLIPEGLGWQRIDLNLSLAEDLRKDFKRKLEVKDWVKDNQGDGKQLEYYLKFLESKGIKVRDKPAGGLYAAISSLIPKELGWQRIDLSLGLAEDLRKDFEGKLEDKDWVKDNQGNGKQLEYYLKFLESKGMKARNLHAGGLYSAISSLIPEGLGWYRIGLNLGLAEDLRDDFKKKLEDPGWVESHGGNGNQLKYYREFFRGKKSKIREPHAGNLYTAIASLIPEGLGWQRIDLNLSLAEDLRKDFKRKLEVKDWVKNNQGDGKQLEYYLKFFESKKMKARDLHAGTLYSAISSLIPEGLGWHRIGLNLGLAEDLRKDFEKKLADKQWVQEHRGNPGQIQYYADAIGGSVVGQHAGNLYRALSSLRDRKLIMEEGSEQSAWQALDWKMMEYPMAEILKTEPYSTIVIPEQGFLARSEARVSIQKEIFSNLTLALKPRELKGEVPRSELRKAARQLAGSGINPGNLEERLKREVEISMPGIIARRAAALANAQTARAVGLQRIYQQLFDTLKIYGPGNADSPFAFGFVSRPGEEEAELREPVLEAVKPGATVLVSGKVPEGLTREVLAREGHVRPVEKRNRPIQLPGNQPEAAMVTTEEISQALPEVLRPFYLDLASLRDPDARSLGMTLLVVAAVHYGRLVTDRPELLLKPELLKAELLRRLQLFENFPDIFKVRGLGQNWGLDLIGETVQKFMNAKLTAVAA